MPVSPNDKLKAVEWTDELIAQYNALEGQLRMAAGEALTLEETRRLSNDADGMFLVRERLYLIREVCVDSLNRRRRK